MARKRPGRKRGENGKGKHLHMFMRSSETYSMRLAAINYYRDHRNMDATIAKLFPGIEGTLQDTKRKSIYLWEKKRARIEAACETTKGGQMKCARDLGTATMLSLEAESQIVQWIDDLRGEGAPVSAFMLRSKAQDVAAAEGLSSDNFKASWTFRKGFLRHHLLSLRRHTRQGQKPPSDSNAAKLQFREKVLQLMQEHGVDHVYNADQTAVFFEYLPKQTISGRGAKTVWVRCAGTEKERVTEMLLGDSRGTRYTPFVIAKSKSSGMEDTAAENKELRHGFGIYVWKEVLQLQNRLNVVMYGNNKGWWNGELSLVFLRHNFVNRPNRDQPVLLLWDDLSAHWTSEVKACAEELNVVLVPVPPGCTSVCQPADISWNMPLKARLRARWLQNLQVQFRLPRHAGVKFKLAAPKRKDVTEWVVAAWEGLNQTVIKSGFSFIFRSPDATTELADTALPVGTLDTSTTVINELRAS